jgi:CxxC motif-containing protein
MATIKEVKCDAPVISGQVILTDVLGLGVDLICTKSVEKA